MFLRDAGSFAAYLVDAETGELHPTLSHGQREYDLDTAATNVAGELMDLAAGGRLQEGIDPIVTGVGLRLRYDALWDTINQPFEFTRENSHALDKQIRKLNELGFDVAELQVDASKTGDHVRVFPKVVDAGHHSRRLIRLTGLDVGENQARRLLNDLDSYRINLGYEPEDEELAAHRWFLSEASGHSVPFAQAVHDYVSNVLARKPEEKAVLGSRSGTPSDATEELRIVIPD